MDVNLASIDKILSSNDRTLIDVRRAKDVYTQTEKSVPYQQL